MEVPIESNALPTDDKKMFNAKRLLSADFFMVSNTLMGRNKREPKRRFTFATVRL
jgi:hypothetical protein